MEQRSNSVKKVREYFDEILKMATLADVQKHTNLKDVQVSVALLYLFKKGELTREQISNPTGKGRKTVWLYKGTK